MTRMEGSEHLPSQKVRRSNAIALITRRRPSKHLRSWTNPHVLYSIHALRPSSYLTNVSYNEPVELMCESNKTLSKRCMQLTEAMDLHGNICLQDLLEPQNICLGNCAR